MSALPYASIVRPPRRALRQCEIDGDHAVVGNFPGTRHRIPIAAIDRFDTVASDGASS
ncbi:MAG TPA: hypothetical protein VH914_08160 [Acidimicrobiia bacterium]|nr:hypothetical protein [Acidimicrobiia bacterium]